MNKLIKAKNWRKLDDGYIVVANHEESIKTKNIVEKIKFSDVSSVMLSAIKPLDA
jgi:translation initiation factor 3 subunit K